MNKIFFIVFILGTLNTLAQPDAIYQWAKGIGGSDGDQSFSIAVDGLGNVYITGVFRDTVDFDPGAGTANLTAVGFEDIFFAKYDNSGNYIWANRMGSAFNDNFSYSIAVDSSGNVHITGYYSGTVDFDPGVGTVNLTSASNSDIFFAKYDNNGNYLWANGIGSGGLNSGIGKSITVDNSGNVYITGRFESTVDFDPDTGIANLTSVGWKDAFFAKYDSNGNYIWAKGIGSSGFLTNDEGYGIALDSSGNVYITGIFMDTADFNPGIDTFNLIATVPPYGNIFFAKYDNNGNFIWAKNFGGSMSEVSRSIDVDGLGNVYITGYFQDTADFDPGVGTANLTSIGNRDIFFAKYDDNGDYIWANSIGGSNMNEGNGIALDNFGNVYITGYFQDTADFDPGAGTANLISAASWGEDFFAKYDNSGNYLWAKGISYTGGALGNDITVDDLGNVYITGNFMGIADFDPGPGTSNLISVGSSDIFFAKYEQVCQIPTAGFKTK